MCLPFREIGKQAAQCLQDVYLYKAFKIYKATIDVLQTLYNKWMKEWMRLNCVYPLLAGNPCIFLSHPIRHPYTISALGWRQEIEWFPANDLSARGNETRIRSKNPLGKLGFHIEVKACMKSHSLIVALIKPMALCTGLLWMNEIMVCISFPHTRHAIWLFFCLPFLPYIVKQNNAWLHFK